MFYKTNSGTKNGIHSSSSLLIKTFLDVLLFTFWGLSFSSSEAIDADFFNFLPLLWVGEDLKRFGVLLVEENLTGVLLAEDTTLDELFGLRVNDLDLERELLELLDNDDLDLNEDRLVLLEDGLVVLARLWSIVVEARVLSLVVAATSSSVSDGGLSVGHGSSTPSSEESESNLVFALFFGFCFSSSFSSSSEESRNLNEKKVKFSSNCHISFT